MFLDYVERHPAGVYGRYPPAILGRKAGTSTNSKADGIAVRSGKVPSVRVWAFYLLHAAASAGVHGRLQKRSIAVLVE